MFSNKENLSYCNFNLVITNSGNEPIEEYQILLEFKGDIQDLSNTNKIANNYTSLQVIGGGVPEMSLSPEDMTGKIIPRKKVLVGDDSFKSDTIYIKSTSERGEVIINWKLISRNFKDSGELKINLRPFIDIEFIDIIVEDPSEVKTIYGNVEECIVDRD